MSREWPRGEESASHDCAQNRSPIQSVPTRARRQTEKRPTGSSISVASWAGLREVRMGFEPTYVGFANRCLTAWLPHHRSNGMPSGPSPHTPGRSEGQQLLSAESATSPPKEKATSRFGFPRQRGIEGFGFSIAAGFNGRFEIEGPGGPYETRSSLPSGDSAKLSAPRPSGAASREGSRS